MVLILVFGGCTISTLSLFQFTFRRLHTNYSFCHFNRMTRIHQILKTTHAEKEGEGRERERGERGRESRLQS
jgi:hypothetical protein